MAEWMIRMRNEKKNFGDNRGFSRGKDSQRGNGPKKGFGKRDFKSEDNRESKGFKREKPSYSKQIEDTEVIANEDMLEGRNPILEALKANRAINKILVAKGDLEGSIRQIIAIAKEKKIIIQEVDRARLDLISATKAHQGIIAYVAMKDYVEVDDIIRGAIEKGEQPFIIILDEIADPHNLGSILRTADAVGAHGVIIPKRRAVGLTSTVAKAAAGAIEYVPVARVTNMAQTIESLKKQNIWVVGTDSTGEKYYYEHDLKGAIAVVIGSEGEGMARLVKEKCDFVVKIPMKGNISSLNASVAGAVIMYEVMRQRGV